MRKWFEFMVLALALALVVSCGGSSKTSASSSSAQSAGPQQQAQTEQVTNLVQQTEEIEATSELAEKTVNIGVGTTIETLTPIRSNTANTSPIFVQLYETLAVISEDKELEPYLAKSWSTDDNGYTYIIEIWDNIYDSAGNHITSSDIVWNILESKARALRPTYTKVKNAEVIDDTHLKLELTSNVVGTFETLMGSDLMIVSEKAFKESPDEFALSPISTSPYIVTGFTSTTSVFMERRDDYWQDIDKLPESVRPIAKYVNYYMIPEAFQLGVALETGTVDAVIDIASSTGAQYVGNDNYLIELSDGPQGWQLYFSGVESSMVAENEALRKAICYAIDANGLVTALSAGFGTPMYDACSPQLIGFNNKWRDEPYYEYDLEEAKRLLAEAGYNGEKLVMMSTSSAFASRLGQLIQNYLRAAGVNVELNSVDMALYTAMRLDGTKYDLLLNTVGGITLADNWTMRFDPASYSTGDGTGRKDYVLAGLLYDAWTQDGWTEENIDKVHYYLKDHAIAYGLVNPQVFTIWSNKLGLKKMVKGGRGGYISFPSCQYE